MAQQFNLELNRSRYGTGGLSNTKYYRQYKLECETDEEVALQHLLNTGLQDGSTVPTQVTFNGMTLTNRTIQSLDPLEDHDCDKWKVVVCWDTGSGDFLGALCEEDEFQFGIDVTGQQQRIDWACESTLYKFGNNIELFANGRLIVDCNDEIGTDVIIAQKKYTETACFPRNFVTKAWCAAAADAVGKTNAFLFRNCAPCELLLTGINGQATGFGPDSMWIITFEYCLAPNIVIDVPIWNPMTKMYELQNIAMGGHDRLVPLDCHTRLTDMNRIKVYDVIAWAVHRVYKKRNFAAQLGI